MGEKESEEKHKEDKEENSDNMWLGIGIGIIVGGILLAIIIKSRSTTPPAPVSYVPYSMFPNVPSQVMYPSQPVVTMSNPLVPSAYKNNETWEMERGEDGLIKRITVERDVKQDADPGQE